jgi:hypothetical protein
MRTKNIGTTPGGQAHGGVRSATVETPPRDVRAVAVWIGIGFIAGAVFCTALGFWKSRPVAPEATAQAASAPTVPAVKSAALINSTAAALPSIYLVDPANCSALQLNRETNRTELRPCPSSGLALRLDPETPREDMAGILSTTAQASADDGN